MLHHDQLRADQEAYARNQAKTNTEYTASSRPAGRRQAKPGSPKGHEALLKGLELANATVTFEKISTGEHVVGKVKCSDKYTVSVMTDAGTRVLFKHDISEFIAQPRPSEVEAH